MNSDTQKAGWLLLCMAPVINAPLVGTCPRTKGYRVQCHLSIFICLCYISVLVYFSCWCSCVYLCLIWVAAVCWHPANGYIENMMQWRREMEMYCMRCEADWCICKTVLRQGNSLYHAISSKLAGLYLPQRLSSVQCAASICRHKFVFGTVCSS